MSRLGRIAYGVAEPLTASAGIALRPLAPLLAKRFTPPHKLHLGSGLVHLEGWVNIDWKPIPYSILRREPGPDLHADLSRALPFGDGSATHVYTNSFLEHIDRSAAMHCLAEAARVLKPGGRIRVAVPDVAAYAQAYVSGDAAFFEVVGRASDYWPTDLRTPMEYLATIIHGVDELGWRHLWGYDLETLSLYLENAGFRNVERFDVNESPDPVLRNIDGDPLALLIVEAVRA